MEMGGGNVCKGEAMLTGGLEGRKRDLVGCLQGIRRMLRAERSPGIGGLSTLAGPRVMDGDSQRVCRQAVKTS